MMMIFVIVSDKYEVAFQNEEINKKKAFKFLLCVVHSSVSRVKQKKKKVSISKF